MTRFVKFAAESKKERKNSLGNGVRDTESVKQTFTTTLTEKPHRNSRQPLLIVTSASNPLSKEIG